MVAAPTRRARRTPAARWRIRWRATGRRTTRGRHLAHGGGSADPDRLLVPSGRRRRHGRRLRRRTVAQLRAPSDRWARLPAPPERVDDTGSLSAVGGNVHALARSGRVLVLDVETERWSRLPADNLEPALDPQGMLGTDEGSSSAVPIGRRPTTETPPASRRRPLGRRGVDAAARRPGWSAGCASTGPASTDRPRVGASRSPPVSTADPPFGGRLDPDTGEWSLLPNVPDEDDRLDGWSPPADDGPLMSAWGYVYDDRDRLLDAARTPRDGRRRRSEAVWADGRLIVFGGLDEETGYVDPEGLSDQTWIWSPE